MVKSNRRSALKEYLRKEEHFEIFNLKNLYGFEVEFGTGKIFD